MRVILILFIGLSSALVLLQSYQNPLPELLFSSEQFNRPVSSQAAPLHQAQILSSSDRQLVHAATAAMTGDGDLLAAWFGGTREGHRDVDILSKRLSNASWSKESVLISRLRAAKDLRRYLRKLGNPLLITRPSGELWMIYVSTTIGGWATSQLNITKSYDSGINWERSQRLVTSPFLNVSTLVKAPPIYYPNGFVGIPIYHELAGKFGEYLILNERGEIIKKTRIDHGRRSIQPMILPFDQHNAFVMMRNTGPITPRYALQSSTSDAGLSWETVESSQVLNPNAAVAGLTISPDLMVLIANLRQDDRAQLSLLISQNQGKNWRTIYHFEDLSSNKGHFKQSSVKDGSLFAQEDIIDADIAQLQQNISHNQCDDTGRCKARYGYPYLIESSPGQYDLFYTWHRTAIKTVRFNLTWLNQKIEQSQLDSKS